jgi:hypothetical protein
MMKKSFAIACAGFIASAALMLYAAPAMAHDQVNWSITVGSPTYAPPVVYSQPSVIYSRPPVIYTQPRVVYTERAPLVQYRAPYYRERQWREQEWREHGRHERWERHARLND